MVYSLAVVVESQMRIVCLQNYLPNVDRQSNTWKTWKANYNA
jgi:hypothetical protein